MKIDFSQFIIFNEDKPVPDDAKISSLKNALTILGLEADSDIWVHLLEVKSQEKLQALSQSSLVEINKITDALALLREFLKNSDTYALEVFGFKDPIPTLTDDILSSRKTALITQLENAKTNQTDFKYKLTDIRQAYAILKANQNYLNQRHSNTTSSNDYKESFIRFLAHASFTVRFKELLTNKINEPSHLETLIKLHNANKLTLAELFQGGWLKNHEKYLAQDDLWDELFSPKMMLKYIKTDLKKIPERYDQSSFETELEMQLPQLALPENKKNKILENLMRLRRNKLFFRENNTTVFTQFFDDTLQTAMREKPLLWDILADEHLNRYLAYNNTLSKNNFKLLFTAFAKTVTEKTTLKDFYRFFLIENDITTDKLFTRRLEDDALFSAVLDIYKTSTQKDKFATLLGDNYCYLNLAIELTSIFANENCSENNKKYKNNLVALAKRSNNATPFSTLLHEQIIASIQSLTDDNCLPDREIFFETVFEKIENANATPIAEANRTPTNTTTTATSSAPSHPAVIIPVSVATTPTTTPSGNQPTEQPTTPSTFWQRNQRALIGLGIGFGIAVGLLLLTAATIFTLGAIHIISAPTLFTLLSTVAVPVALKWLTLPAASAATAEAIVIGTGAGSTAGIATGLGLTGAAFGHHQDKKVAKATEVERAKRASAAATPAPSGDSSITSTPNSSQTYKP